MDHYCPWIYNCVGFHNRKYFILLLLNASTSLIAYCIFAVDTVRDAANMRVRRGAGLHCAGGEKAGPLLTPSPPQLELSTAFNALMSFFVAALLVRRSPPDEHVPAPLLTLLTTMPVPRALS